jgi:hypothetical protein
MIRSWIWRAALLVAPVACHPAPAARPSEPVANAAPAVTARPSSVACVRGTRCSLAWHAGSHEVIATVVPADDGEGGADVEIAISGTPEPEHLSLGSSVRVTRLSVLDVTGDGQPEVVVWIDPASGPAYESARSTYVFEVEVLDRQAGGLRVSERRWTEAALGVVSSTEELRDAASRLRTFPGGDRELPAELLVLRLGYATADQFRSLVGPGGLDVCQEQSGNARPHGKHCTHYTRAQLTDAVFATLGIAFSGERDDEPEYHAVQPCSRSGHSELCAQGTGGPANLEFVFTGSGAGRQLQEINHDEYESG